MPSFVTSCAFVRVGGGAVPGSHKSALPIPERVMWCDDMATVRHPTCKAGSVLLFLGSGVSHGAVCSMHKWPSKLYVRLAMIV